MTLAQDIGQWAGRMVQVVVGGESLKTRRAADRRRALYHQAFGLRPDATCLLDQLAQANGRLVTNQAALRTIGRRGQVVDLRPRSPEVCMIDIRQKVGADAVETVRGCSWRLTPLGRLRVMRAQGVVFSAAQIGIDR